MTSIRSRILVPFAAAAAAILFLSYWTIIVFVQRDLRASLDNTIQAMAVGLGSAMELEIGGTFTLEIREPQLSEYSPDKGTAFYLIRDQSGARVASSLDRPPELGLDFPNPKYTTTYIDGKKYRIYSFAITKQTEMEDEDFASWEMRHPGQPLPAIESRQYVVSVGHVTEKMDETITILKTELAYGLLCLFIALLIIPTWVVTKALRPLATLSMQANELVPESGRNQLDEQKASLEVRSLVTALNRALARLTNAYMKQKQFTSDAAHELRTPISAVRVQCEVALRKEHGTEELRKTLETVNATMSRFSDIVENLLSLARFQSGGDPSIADSLVDMGEACLDALELNTAAADLKGVKMERALTPGISTRGNKTLIVEAISNLLENAIQYTPSGGRVKLELVNNPNPTVIVSDTGIGIEKEHHKKIFDRFYRVGKGRNRADGGAGLGLAIVSEIAKLHDAVVVVESAPGKGSRFEIRFRS